MIYAGQVEWDGSAVVRTAYASIKPIYRYYSL
jgi:hypothetical protein